MRIIKATYGGKDCTAQIQDKVKNGVLLVHADNNIIGDPAVGTAKFLELVYEFTPGMPVQAVFREGELCRIQKDPKSKLGIFYSNNNNPRTKNTILKSLETIQKASEGKADILTCFWIDEPNCPFNRLKAWYQVPSHLTQLLQIMQLLYTAKQSGNYEYVSFLEHDVLYPQGYFDFPDFPSGTTICNMNYMGVNKDGWQPRMHDHQPFHQMTMRFEDAVKHCEKILPNAITTNSGMIEPQNGTRGSWNCENPAVHVNHGYHFTSHYSIYGPANSKKESYWGDHDQLLYLFNHNE